MSNIIEGERGRDLYLPPQPSSYMKPKVKLGLISLLLDSVGRERGSSLRFSGNLYSCKMSISIVKCSC